MCSDMGRNVQFYCERFGTTLHDAATVAKERKVEGDKEVVWRACMIKELLVMVHDGVCCLLSEEFV